MIDWSNSTLCVDADLLQFESNVLSWTKAKGDAGKWRATAKTVIEHRLRSQFRALEIKLELGKDDDVLDLISSVSPLNIAACYFTLHLLATDCTMSVGDHYDANGQLYLAKFEEEWPRALGMLSVDTDESGEIGTAEKYNVQTGATFVRGA
jgi:hypothetical protein